MIKTTQGYRAHELESIIVATSEQGFASRNLYVIEGLPGLYRRKPRAKPADRAPDVIVAFFDTGMIDLVRDRVIEAELFEAGFSRPDTLLKSVAASLRAAAEELDPIAIIADGTQSCNVNGSFQDSGKDGLTGAASGSIVCGTEPITEASTVVTSVGLSGETVIVTSAEIELEPPECPPTGEPDLF